MSMIIVAKFPGDTDKFRASMTERASEYVAIADRAKGMGALHHRFGAGDGYVVVVDEWETVEAFEKFFGDPALQEFIGSVGAAGPPEVIVSQAVSSPDQF